MSNIEFKKSKMCQLIGICVFPVVVFLMQTVSSPVVLLACLIFIISAIFFPKLREILLVYIFVILGYLFWRYMSESIFNKLNYPLPLTKVFSRLGLAGYILLFALWYLIKPPQNRFFRYGDSKAIIRFPFVWKGFKETEWRFTLIFSLICVGFSCFFMFTKEISLQFFLYGLLFSLVNAFLEEILWRGFILTRLIDISGEKIALIVSSLSFGLYHFSLHFPVWICLIFAIGGFYMGGSAMRSKGLFSPIIMHIMVNLVFVFAGIIF